MFLPLIVLLLAYLVGSLPFAVWLTRLVTNTDVRSGGSGHAGATNTMRQAGWLAGVAVLVLDLAKGFLPVAVARWWALPGWVIGLTTALVIAGHCWPLFAGFRGGMGLATAGGAMFAVSPLSFAILLGVIVALTLALRHTARAAVVMGMVALPLLWLFGMPGPALWAAAGMGLVVSVRFLDDWQREYRELWLDRE